MIENRNLCGFPENCRERSLDGFPLPVSSSLNSNNFLMNDFSHHVKEWFLSILLLFFVLFSEAAAETHLLIEPEPAGKSARAQVHREFLGVNQLAYGHDSYGFLLRGQKKVNPEMVQILREIGVRSMRYPGGCGGTHSYDWQKSAGLKGGYPGLGLMEFLRVCEEIDAEPMLGLSAFRGSPAEAAEFVEFLNAPNDGKSHWAAERARLGHPQPFGVRYVEYGNESYHGNHSVTPNQLLKPADYARNYLEFRTAMKKVDPAVELGIILGPDFWNRGVFAGVGTDFDFAIIHHYQSVRQVGAEEYAQNFVVMGNLLKQKNDCLKYCPPEKKTDVKLALTEFNATFAEHKHLAAALMNAETLFFLFQDPNYFSAQYWQFVNEGFGMVRGEAGNFVKRPNALMFELVSGALLEQVLPLKISGRMTDEAAKKASSANVPEETDDRILPTPEDAQKNLYEKPAWKWHGKEGRTSMERLPDGVLSIRFLTDEAFNFYHVAAWKATEKWKAVRYHLTAEIRAEGMPNSSGGALELGDGRGFTATRSVAATESVLTEEWTPVSVDYYPLPDTKSLELKVRRFSGGGKGLIQIRNLRVVPMRYEPEVKPVISALLTTSRDENQLAFLLVNRSFEPETVTLDLKESASDAFRNREILRTEARTLAADEPYATNEKNADSVRIQPLNATLEDGRVRVTVPPYSMVGVRVELKAAKRGNP